MDIWQLRGFKQREFSGSDFKVSVTRKWSLRIYQWKKNTIVARYILIEIFTHQHQTRQERLYFQSLHDAYWRSLPLTWSSWSRRCSWDEDRWSLSNRCRTLHPTAMLSVRTFESLTNLTHLSPKYCCYRLTIVSESVLWSYRNRYRHFPDAWRARRGSRVAISRESRNQCWKHMIYRSIKLISSNCKEQIS